MSTHLDSDSFPTVTPRPIKIDGVSHVRVGLLLWPEHDLLDEERAELASGIVLGVWEPVQPVAAFAEEPSS